MNEAILDIDKGITLKSEPKTAPCEICGDEVTTSRLGRLAHMRKHNVNANTKTAEVPVKDRPLPDTSDERLLADVKYARLVAERRRVEAPAVAQSTAGVGSLMKNTVKRLRASGVIPHGVHPFFGDATKYRTYIAQGYEPVVEAGRQVSIEDVQLFMLPQDVHEAHEMASMNLSKRLLNEQLQKSQERTTAMNIKGADGKLELSKLEKMKLPTLGENADGGNSNPGEPPMGG